MFLERKVYIISSANNDSIFNQINHFLILTYSVTEKFL